MDYVDIVALLVYNGEEVIVEKRDGNKETDPGKVVTPSGHVEKGESLEEACERELEEELGLVCEDFEKIGEDTHSTRIEEQRVHYFECHNWRGKPTSEEADKIYWVGPQELDILDISGDRKIVESYLRSKEN